MTLIRFNYLTPKAREVVIFNIVNAFVNFLVAGDSVCLARRKTTLVTKTSKSLVTHILKEHAKVQEMLGLRIQKRLSTKTRWV